MGYKTVLSLIKVTKLCKTRNDWAEAKYDFT